MSLEIQLGDVNVANLEQLKIMNCASLPVRYTDKFYRGKLFKLKYQSLPLQYDLIQLKRFS